MIDWTEEKIHALLRDLKTAASDQEALDWLNERVEQGGIFRKDCITFLCGDYQIQLMLSLLRKAQIKGFQNVAGYGLSIAPEFVDAFEVGETAGNPNVATFFLVTRIKGMAGRPLIPLMEGFGLLDEGAKQAAMEDIQRLAEAGWKMSLFAFIHPDKTWFVTAGDHRLVCPCVIGFDKLQTGEKERYLQRCRDLLFHNKALARR